MDLSAVTQGSHRNNRFGPPASADGENDRTRSGYSDRGPQRSSAGCPPAECPSAKRRAARGRRAQRCGVDGEGRVAQALAASGWTIRARRLRTAAGEIDIAAERDGLLALIEVKTRDTLDTAAYALGPRQRRRLIQAAAIVQGENPAWGPAGMRFDAWLVDAMGRLRHVPDAFRDEG